MAKQIKTFHPLAVSKSIEAQNEAVGLLMSKVRLLTTVGKGGASLERLRPLLDELETDLEKVRKIMWPED